MYVHVYHKFVCALSRGHCLGITVLEEQSLILLCMSRLSEQKRDLSKVMLVISLCTDHCSIANGSAQL